MSTDGAHLVEPPPTAISATIDPRHHDVVVFALDCAVRSAVSEGRREPLSGSMVALIPRLRAAGLGTAALVEQPTRRRARHVDTFEDLVDVVIDQAGAADNPDPGLLARTAHQLGTRPGRCVVIAASPGAIEAGRRAGFARVIGIACAGDGEQLVDRGADVVVDDTSEIGVRTDPRRIAELPDALECLDELLALLAFRVPAVLFDFDGTLSPIVKDPNKAVLIPGVAQPLESLAACCPVAVISGRDLVDIRRRVGLSGIWYAGSHGLDVRAPSGLRHRTRIATSIAATLTRVAVDLAAELGDVSGITIEHKKFSLAVHYRAVPPEHIDLVIATARRIAQRENLRCIAGRKVIEICPNMNWNKGNALDWMLPRMKPETALLPIYFGDDLTDEDAFDAVRFDGVGIVVAHGEDGNRPSAASYKLDNPDAVRTFVQHLADEMVRLGAVSTSWVIDFDGYDPDQERLREALCTVGNGRFATRGCAPEARTGRSHYPGTYAAGVYNRLTDNVAGHHIENESLVNLPNWLPLTFRFNGEPWFDIDDAELLAYTQSFDLRHAVLTRRFRFRDHANRITAVTQHRLAAMHLPNLAALQTIITAENWSGTIQFRSLLDGEVGNTLVDRYRELSDKHLTFVDAIAVTMNSVLLNMQTNQSHITVAMAARTTAWVGDDPAAAQYQFIGEHHSVGHDITVPVETGQSITVEKVVSIVTGRDPAISEPATEATRCLQRIGRYSDIRRGHSIAWAQLWERFNITMDSNTDEVRIARLHLLHVLQTVSPHSCDLDVGVPARGLGGEAYRGHVFWDELFVAPVLSLRDPGIPRGLLTYRYRRLPEARRSAQDAGFSGAMFPWQSGSSGREESQRFHLNPRSGRWNPDPSALAHHVGLAIAYNIWQYYQITGDLEYLVEYGTEMLLEIARFWGDFACFSKDRSRYVIRGVIGPDEFHSGYPGRLYDGIDNNAYTNVMVVWVILRALDALALLGISQRRGLLERLGLDGSDLTRWDHVSRRMFVPFHEGVISQFEGYELLDELDWEAYRNKYLDIQRLDRILEAENDNVNNYKASKQADTLMLFYLLSADELRDLFGRLGYKFTPEQIPKTIEYYLSRTSHGSTLSAVVHAWVLARGNRDRAVEFYTRALHSDIADIQGGTTAEGVHLAAMAGSVDLLQRCFSGLETRADRLVLCPCWPEGLGVLAFAIHYRGHRLHLQIEGRTATVTAAASNAAPISVECRGRLQQLAPGSTIDVG